MEDDEVGPSLPGGAAFLVSFAAEPVLTLDERDDDAEARPKDRKIKEGERARDE